MSPQFSPLVQESFLEEEIPESLQRRGQLQVRKTPSHECASLDQREVSCCLLIPIFGMGRKGRQNPGGRGRGGSHITPILQIGPDSTRIWGGVREEANIFFKKRTSKTGSSSEIHKYKYCSHNKPVSCWDFFFPPNHKKVF